MSNAPGAAESPSRLIDARIDALVELVRSAVQLNVARAER